MVGVLHRRHGGLPPSAQAPAPQRGGGPTPAVRSGSARQEHRAQNSRCFELRTYTVRAEGPGSIDLLHSRFRQHTNRLFRKHGMDDYRVLAPDEQAEHARSTCWPTRIVRPAMRRGRRSKPILNG